VVKKEFTTEAQRAQRKTARQGLILLNEELTFSDDCKPSFTFEQTRRTTEATREGLALWARTPTGCAMIKQFSRPDYRVFIVEDGAERGMGRAPQPAIGTMISYDSQTSVKVYQIILNPHFARLPRADVQPFDEPKTAAELMSAAWAGEMLHLSFYARGIVLPHHGRADFQREWQRIAAELGYPALEHADSQ
jgi:hypothetical protein